MKVIIAGSRGIDDMQHVIDAVYSSQFVITEVVSGTAAGIDRKGEQYATNAGLPVSRFPADWKNLTVPGAVIKRNSHGQYNAVAGHQRNTQMGNYADALIAIWDGKSKGTLNMVTYMKSLGKPTFVYDVSKTQETYGT